MAYVLRNKSGNYKWFLKTEVPPGGTIDLEDIFYGYTKPKVSSKDQAIRLEKGDTRKLKPEYEPEEFDRFLEDVAKKPGIDSSVWEVIVDTREPEAPVGKVVSKKETKVSTKKDEKKVEEKPTVASRPTRNRTMQPVSVAGVKRKIPQKKDLTPRDIAWMAYDDDTKKLISDYTNVRSLKAALKIVKTVPGQERLRRLIENRVNDIEAGI